MTEPKEEKCMNYSFEFGRDQLGTNRWIAPHLRNSRNLNGDPLISRMNRRSCVTRHFQLFRPIIAIDNRDSRRFSIRLAYDSVV
jgi:hypothetical protein